MKFKAHFVKLYATEDEKDGWGQRDSRERKRGSSTELKVYILCISRRQSKPWLIREKSFSLCAVCEFLSSSPRERKWEKRFFFSVGSKTKYTQLQIKFSTVRTQSYCASYLIARLRQEVNNGKQKLFLFTHATKKHETGLKWSDKSRQKCVRNNIYGDTYKGLPNKRITINYVWHYAICLERRNIKKKEGKGEENKSPFEDRGLCCVTLEVKIAFSQADDFVKFNLFLEWNFVIKKCVKNRSLSEAVLMLNCNESEKSFFGFRLCFFRIYSKVRSSWGHSNYN